LGIGLSLVKSLVEMHEGHVEVHSAGPNAGSEFLVRLPIVDAPATRQARVGSDRDWQTSELRILVVDDNRDAAASLSKLLELMGNTTRTAHDGEEAVTAAAEYEPDVVSLDIGLPKLNGYDTARAIRREPWGRNTVLVAVTGWGQHEDKRRSAESGFNHHLVKPVDPKAIMNLLAELNSVHR
jgi:CheY-like chemotaxis protein